MAILCDLERDGFQVELTPDDAIMFRPGVAYVHGVCFSCGDALPELRFCRCWRCSLAWRLAVRLPIDGMLADAMDTARVSA